MAPAAEYSAHKHSCSRGHVSFGDVTREEFTVQPEQPEPPGGMADPEVVAAPPGLQAPAAQLAPPDLTILVPSSSPMQVAMSCRMLLDSKLPASVAKLPCEAGQKWRVSATVFLDYIALSMEVCISAPRDDATLITLKHASQSDVVRFRRVSEVLVDFLRSSGFSPAAEHGGALPGACAALVDDDFDEFLDDASTEAEESSWSDRVELVMADLDSPSAALREEGVQHVARWAESPPASLAVAQGLADRSEKVGQMFFAKTHAPLTEMYPMAAALRRLACGQSSEAKAVLRKSRFAKMLEKYKPAVAQLPPLVARELTSAAQSMQVAPAQKKLEPIEEVSCLSSASTRCTDLSSVASLGDGSTASLCASASKSGAGLAAEPRADPKACLDKQIPPKLVQMLHVVDNLFQPMGFCE